MQPIPRPQVLDPDRPLRHRGTQFTDDDQPEAELLDKALHESCQYAQQLWDDLNAMRHYLLDCLPPDPRAPGQHTTACASPTGPDDEQGWQNWINAFAQVTSALCGPHGDSGFGLSRAREEAQLRRTAPVLTIRAEHPDLGDAAAAADGKHDAASGHTTKVAGSDSGPGDTKAEGGPRAGQWTPARIASGAVIGVLALRGLRRPSAHRTSRSC